ncbi:MAG: FAD-binding protein, partial [Clostridia bacterium]|nr:FAD-binding protein [Clostridia bacterium]
MEKEKNVLIVGSGAAAYAAALRLAEGGAEDVLILTDRRENGTSRNAGSDKQTYYKLSLAGDAPDSIGDMARNLFEGGSTHGDLAYAMAAGSVRAFLRLAELGVPFPQNEMGEFVGYKTDHDPRSRGTSAGPLTSYYMTAALEKACAERKVPVCDGETAVRLAVENGAVRGVVTVDRRGRVRAWPARNVILATGGPAAIYRNTVYPVGQTGMTGMALEAGAFLENFSEWQYGIASVAFRWNLSGSYQQVIPRYFALDGDGKERDFLRESGLFRDGGDILESVFLKGYQWPFTVGHIDGSSRVDLALYDQLRAGRRVFLDYRRNPAGLSADLGELSPTAAEYLANCGATGATPVERLSVMNPGAIELYARHGIDLAREPLEITLAAQHSNGGIGVDGAWRTGIHGLYAVGEAAGTFGVHRPGGSALNAGQVGALRASEAILSAPETGEAGGECL